MALDHTTNLAAIDRIDLLLASLASEDVITARSDGSRHRPFPVAISLSEGAALREFVEREQCHRTIEIGLGYGVSALFICQGLLAVDRPDARHTVIDPYQRTRFADIGLQLLEDAGLGAMVDHHAEPSEFALPALVAAQERFDLAFVDGSHRFDAVFIDLFFLKRLLRPGAIIVLDDYQLPSVARAAAFFISNLGWIMEQAVTSPDHHWIALRTSTGPDERPFGHFVNF